MTDIVTLSGADPSKITDDSYAGRVPEGGVAAAP
jgi:hypothetical protein